jgi:hypothetical protein
LAAALVNWSRRSPRLRFRLDSGGFRYSQAARRADPRQHRDDVALVIQQRRDAPANLAHHLVADTARSLIERVDIIPTEALYVESELGDCGLCEPYVMSKHELELERLRLENKLLEQEIALLEKHKDYHCCDDEEGDEG